MAKNPDMGKIVKTAALVAGGVGLTTALSSHTTAKLWAMANDSYAEAYDTGAGFKAAAMRAGPGLAATLVMGLVVKKPMAKGVAIALGLAGTAIGTLSPVVEDTLGSKIADAIIAKRIKDGATGGGYGYDGGFQGGGSFGYDGGFQGGPRRTAPAMAAAARNMAAMLPAAGVGGIQNVPVGGYRASPRGGLQNIVVG